MHPRDSCQLPDPMLLEPLGQAWEPWQPELGTEAAVWVSRPSWQGGYPTRRNRFLAGDTNQTVLWVLRVGGWASTSLWVELALGRHRRGGNFLLTRLGEGYFRNCFATQGTGGPPALRTGAAGHVGYTWGLKNTVIPCVSCLQRLHAEVLIGSRVLFVSQPPLPIGQTQLMPTRALVSTYPKSSRKKFCFSLPVSKNQFSLFLF